VKLLLDENLSKRLVSLLQEKFPGTTQVELIGLAGSTDSNICDYASEHGFIVVTKDDDFISIVSARGFSPRLIRLKLGNVTNSTILEKLLAAANSLQRELENPHAGIFEIGSE
jgi:predicted nuclease of predicted toxin-antitoxin system